MKPKPLLEAFVVTDAGFEAPATKLKTRKGEQEIEPGFLAIVDPAPPQIEATKTSTGRRKALAGDWIEPCRDNQLSTRDREPRVGASFRDVASSPTASEFGSWASCRLIPNCSIISRRNSWPEADISNRCIVRSCSLPPTARRRGVSRTRLRRGSNRARTAILWRFHPRRLDAEQVRDALLAVSGELEVKPGGPSGDGNGTRRSIIHVIKKRNSPNELLRALDMPPG